MGHKHRFPPAIRAAILQACENAPTTHYGAYFFHCDDGSPTASVGRLAGGLHAFDVCDDFGVGQDDDGRWAIFKLRNEPMGTCGDVLGSHAVAGTLMAGLRDEIRKLYTRRIRRGRRLAA